MLYDWSLKSKQTTFKVTHWLLECKQTELVLIDWLQKCQQIRGKPWSFFRSQGSKTCVLCMISKTEKTKACRTKRGLSSSCCVNLKLIIDMPQHVISVGPTATYLQSSGTQRLEHHAKRGTLSFIFKSNNFSTLCQKLDN